ncbi:Non-catalytic module family DOC2 [Piromyces sp. E2]|nr:Non-catalytic module family DOC2 [Piromyces sp. E2]|eukprot:OUM69963.1 Non-catalytic module family DOC2 [Piromyces sp. E2]
MKIRGNNDLYGRSQFKLRADCNDPSLMRTKIVSDIHNRLGIPSVSSNHIELYINDEYMGVYLINDAYKLSWIKYKYGEEDTKNLYKCTNMHDFTSFKEDGCTNDNDDIVDIDNDNSEWMEFLKAVDKAKSAADLEDIFEIDHFLTEMAIEYLVGSWDHMQNGHNYYMYKQPHNGKWIYLSQDFDHDFGQEPCEIDVPYTKYFISNHINHLLILSDPSRFERILDDVVQTVFHPNILYARLDELRKIIKSYMVIDKTPDENGHYPGRINPNEDDFFTFEEWNSNIDYISVQKGTQGKSNGLKSWISGKYGYVCSQYNLKACNIYFNETSTITNETQNTESTTTIGSETQNTESTTTIGSETQNTESTTTIGSETQNTESTTTFDSTETSTVDSVPLSLNNAVPTLIEKSFITITKTVSVMTSTASSVVTPSTNTPIYQCQSEIIGYQCCDPKIKTVYRNDEYGDWGYDYAKKEWCGLTPFKDELSSTSLSSSSSDNSTCWSKNLGYPCCNHCIVSEEDDNGQWGIEKQQWCGIPEKCHELNNNSK